MPHNNEIAIDIAILLILSLKKRVNLHFKFTKALSTLLVLDGVVNDCERPQGNRNVRLPCLSHKKIKDGNGHWR